MQGKKAFYGILGCINALFLAICAIKGWGVQMLASFEFAFFTTLCIINLSFLSYKKSVLKKANAERANTQTAGQNFTQIHAPNGDKNSKNAKIQGLTHAQNAEFCPQMQGAQTTTPNQTAQTYAQAHATQNEQSFASNAEFRVQTQGQIHTRTPKICLKKNAPQKILQFKAANDEFKPTLKLAFKSFGVFFSLAKLGAYAFLALGFLALQKQNLLSVAAFLGGISAVLLGVLVFAGFCAYKQKREI